MTSGPVWFLYNQVTEKRFDNLSFEQALKILNDHVFYRIELENWLAWNDTMTEWLPVGGIGQLYSHFATKPEKKKTSPPPIPVVPKKLEEENHLESVNESVTETQTLKKGQIPRRYERYPVRLRVVVFKDDKTFRTYTTDVSEGGMLLENKVPEGFLTGVCEIFIGSPDLKENVQFTGSVIGDAANPYRFGFIEHGEASSKRMIQWLTLFQSIKLKPVG